MQLEIFIYVFAINMFSALKLPSVIIPQVLPHSPISKGTLFEDFQVIFLNLKLSRIQVKEVFRLADLNRNGLIEPEEWKNFYNNFVVPFLSCDTDKDCFLSKEETIECLEKEEYFTAMVKFNKNITSSSNELYSKVYDAMNMNGVNYLNIWDYIQLRNLNKIYSILLDKEEKIFYENFPVALHLISEKAQMYQQFNLEMVFNKTIPFSYFPHKEYMDFATFATFSNLFKLYVNNDASTLGFLSYTDLLSVGKFIPTYKLIKEYTSFLYKTHVIYTSLCRGIPIDSIFYKDSRDRSYRNVDAMKDSGNKLSIDQLYLHYRICEDINRQNITYPFIFKEETFKKFLSRDGLFQRVSELIVQSSQDFIKNCESAGISKTKDDYYTTIFRIIDLNNNTYLEIYELLLLQKATCLFNFLQTDGKIINSKNDTQPFFALGKEYSNHNILKLEKGELDYLTYLNYKFNAHKINFHQFLFLYLNRLRNTNKLVFEQDIVKYLNYFGFYISNEEHNKFIEKYHIKKTEYMSYPLALQIFNMIYSKQF